MKRRSTSGRCLRSSTATYATSGSAPMPSSRRSSACLVGAHSAYSASSVVTAARARPACAQLLVVVAPPLVPVEDGDRDRGEEDEADGEEVELGQQPHAHRRQVEHRRRVGGQRRHVPAQGGGTVSVAVAVANSSKRARPRGHAWIERHRGKRSSRMNLESSTVRAGRLLRGAPGSCRSAPATPSGAV